MNGARYKVWPGSSGENRQDQGRCRTAGTLQQATHYFVVQGSFAQQAAHQAVAWIGQQVQTQASLLAYIDVFWTLTLVSAFAVPLALLLRDIKLGAPTPVGH